MGSGRLEALLGHIGTDDGLLYIEDDERTAARRISAVLVKDDSR